MARWVRQCRNALRFVSVLCRAAIAASGSQRWTLAERQQWLHHYSPKALRVFPAEVQVQGEVPANGLVVSNHLSYLDILVLSSAFPCAFVSKDDVARWPLVGWLCRLAGTIFVDRRSRQDTYRVNDLIRDMLCEGFRVVVFPEGTSSDGSTVLPFHSSLLQPAIDAQATVTPIHISYHVNGGDARFDVCYWGKMVFVPHLWRMLGTKDITAVVRIGDAQRFSDRKTAALESRMAIVSLGSGSAKRDDVAPHL